MTWGSLNTRRLSPTARRRFTTWFALISLTLIAYNLYCLMRLRVSRIRVPVPGLSPRMDGLRVAHLSDFHIGQFGTSRRVLLQARDGAAAFQPDLVAYTGDYVDGPFTDNVDDLQAVLDIPAPRVAVLGNHDYHRGPVHLAQTIRALEYSCVTVLRNEAVDICVRGCWMKVVGLDDPFTGRSDIRLADGEHTDGSCPSLILAHAPVVEEFGNPDHPNVVLCGHTHGGQVRLLSNGDVPGKQILRLFAGESDWKREPDLFRGVHRIANLTVVISDGLGVSMLPLRFRTRPHLVLIELVAT